MKRFLYKIGIFGLLVFVLLNGIAFLSLYFLGKSCLYKPQYLQNGVKENQFDYLVLGSSIGLTTLNTKAIDSLTGKRGLNMSMDDTSMGTHYLMLQHYYALGKKTDNVVLTVTPWDAVDSIPELGNNDFQFITYLREDYAYQYYASMEKELFKPLTISTYFPLIGVSYYNVEVFYPSLLATVHPNKRNRFDDRGNYTYPVNTSDLKGKEQEVSKLLFLNPYYKKIVALCKENNSELVVYIAPMYKRQVVLAVDDPKVINHSEFLSDSKLFYDHIHVNHLGRAEASAEFAKEMRILFENGEK